VWFNFLTLILCFSAGALLGVVVSEALRKQNNGGNSHESFNNRAAGIQSYVVSVAVIVGGAWTLYTFVALDVKTRAERELFAQAQIDIEIDARQEVLEAGDLCIAATVKLTNTGKRNVFLDYRQKPFSVARLTFTHDGNSRFGSPLLQPSLSDFRVLRTGETVRYSYAVTVPEPGMYIVRFMTPIPNVEIDEHDKIANRAGAPRRPADRPVYWAGSTLVNVQKRTHT
jgi:hypothetical protein